MGGTWLGASAAGKLGCLLNIRTPDGPDISKKGRGEPCLVSLGHPLPHCSTLYKEVSNLKRSRWIDLAMSSTRTEVCRKCLAVEHLAASNTKYDIELCFKRTLDRFLPSVPDEPHIPG